MSSQDKYILQFVKGVRSRLCRQTFIKWFLMAAAAGLFVWGVFNTVALIIPFHGAILYGLGAFVIVLIVGSLMSIRHFPNVKEAAFQVDATGLKERVTTSLDLSGNEDGFSNIVKEDTIRRIRNYPTKKFFPTRVSRRLLLVLFLCMAFVISTAMIPAKSKDVAKQKHELWKQEKEMQKQIEEYKEEIEEKYDLTPEQQEMLDDMVDEALEEVKKAKTNEELTKIFERLQNKVEKQITKPIDFDNSAESLKERFSDAQDKEMTQAEQQELIDELQKLAEESQDEELKEQAEKMQEELDQQQKVSKESMEEAKEKLEQFQKEQQEYLEQQKQQQQQGQEGQEGQEGQQGQ